MDNNKNGNSSLIGTVAVLAIALLIWKILPGLFKLASMLIVAALIIFAIVVVIMVIYAIKSPVKQQRGGVETDTDGSVRNGGLAQSGESAQGIGAARDGKNLNGRTGDGISSESYPRAAAEGSAKKSAAASYAKKAAYERDGTAGSGHAAGMNEATDTDVDGNGTAGTASGSSGASASNLPEELKKAKMCLLDIMNENVKIRDTEVRGLSSRVTSSADKIINTLAEQPEDIRKCRQFYNYYLPTYLKILKKYRKLELSGLEIGDVRTELLTYMKRIGAALDKQYEMLFENDKFDLSVEMEALDQSLKRSGLLTDVDTAPSNAGSPDTERANARVSEAEITSAESPDKEIVNAELSGTEIVNAEIMDAEESSVHSEKIIAGQENENA